MILMKWQYIVFCLFIVDDFYYFDRRSAHNQQSKKLQTHHNRFMINCSSLVN